ncbi:NAC domain, partial [Arabidopsis thaliana x Arabidopsis arenosa]
MSIPRRNKRKERCSQEPQTQPPSENPSSSLAADNMPPPSTLAYLLPPVGFEKGNEKEWFIISERNKVDQGLSKKKRVGNGATKQKRGDTKGGYWHATGAAQEINTGEGVVGYKMALAYFVRTRSGSVKTDWLMIEYSLHHTCHNNDKDYTLCKIYMTPQAIKKTKEVEEENKKQKIGEGVTCGSINGSKTAIAHVEALEQQQPGNVEYHQTHQLQGPLDSYQPQPVHDVVYQQPQQFSQAPVDSYQQQPAHDVVYQQPQQFSQAPPIDSYQQQPAHDVVYQQPQQFSPGMAMTGWSNDKSTQEDLLDMSKDDRFFSMDELFNNVEEHGTVVTQQQQQQQQQLSTPIL